MSRRVIGRPTRAPREIPATLGGWTLVELLVAIALVAILAALLTPAWLSGLEKSNRASCQQKMRQLGSAIFAWSVDHGMEWPRSSHTAFAHGQRGWARAILPYLGHDQTIPNAQFRELQKTQFRCPSDQTRQSGSSYGLNVYFELDPDFDDYEGAPAQWRYAHSLPHPSRTILLAEVPGTSDHVMAHFWQSGGGGYDVAASRHARRSNFLFADGSIEALELQETFHPAAGVNLWHPLLAGK